MPIPSPQPPPSPQPTPDPNAALAAYAQQAVASLDTIEAGLGDDQTLAPKDKRRAAKLRKGGGPIATQIGSLAAQQQLESPALQVATMLMLLGKAGALQPLANRLAAFVAHVSDVIFAAQSQAWAIAMQYYALLRRRAKTDRELATALEPVTQFLAYRHPSTKAPAGSPTKKQVGAAKKAQKALATVAGGKLAGTNLLNPRKKPTQPAAPEPAPAASPAPSPVPSPATTGNGVPGAGPSPATSGGAPPATRA
jgi:hypothetical protein